MRRPLTIILSVTALAAAAGTMATVRSEAATEQQFTLPAEFADVATIAAVEVRDSAGHVVLHGTFSGTAEANGDVERRAPLSARDGSSASGEAEIEITKSKGGVEVEVELDASGLAASSAYTMHLDGRHAAAFTTDGKGEAEVELVPAGGK